MSRGSGADGDLAEHLPGRGIDLEERATRGMAHPNCVAVGGDTPRRADNGNVSAASSTTTRSGVVEVVSGGWPPSQAHPAEARTTASARWPALPDGHR